MQRHGSLKVSAETCSFYKCTGETTETPNFPFIVATSVEGNALLSTPCIPDGCHGNFVNHARVKRQREAEGT